MDTENWRRVLAAKPNRRKKMTCIIILAACLLQS
jgi:hypothetical protein